MLLLEARCTHECEGSGDTETFVPGTHLSQQLHKKESATQTLCKSCAYPLGVIENTRGDFPRGSLEWPNRKGLDGNACPNTCTEKRDAPPV